jgi:hypothetical protein
MAKSFVKRFAWFWILLPIPLFAVAFILPFAWPPSELAEPPLGYRLFYGKDKVLVTKSDEGFRFVPFGNHESVNPLWAVGYGVISEQRTSWRPITFLPGFFKREATWSYKLSAVKYSNGTEESLSSTDLEQLRPLVREELNRRDPIGRSGEKFEALLEDGARLTSFVCPQNALTLLAWVSLPLAIFGLIALIFPSD